MSQDATSTCIEGIEEKHGSLTPIAEKRCMYKVHEQLRKVNKEAYEPVLLAIGPYNYNQGKPVGGAFMKERKERYLQQMLERTTGSKERYMKALEKLEVKARTCYVECTSQISPREFAEMMLLDGCFIIELFHKCKTRDCPDDPIFKMEWVLPRIARDLLLFENQLPFFVLLELFRMTESRNSREIVIDVDVESSTSKDLSICKLSHLALKFFHRYLSFEWDVHESNYNSKEKIEHLVCLMNEALIPSLPKMVWKRLQVGFRFKNVDQFEHLLRLIHATICISILDAEIAHARERHDQAKKVILKMPKIFQHPVIPLLAKRKDMSNQEPLLPEELKEAGIELKKSKNNNMFSIKFNNALMEVSPLLIDDRTETCLRNLIAYEQYCDRDESLNYVTNYVFFMDSLINSTKDVELLRRRGIIQNYLGDDKATSTMVNKLCDNINLSTYNIYSRTSRNLNKHCTGRCNKQMAKLKRDYFNSPWAWISFLAATLLLVLTFVQTVFSIIP
ncbi:hypothetical protein I3760_01G105400 [Carya illinoinensis]|nr:hypothetical protein I3760_01G105400 [Carya illinoinensis]